jgi:thioredoxin 1
MGFSVALDGHSTCGTCIYPWFRLKWSHALATEGYVIFAVSGLPQTHPESPSSDNNVETLVSASILHVTDAEFEEKVLKSSEPVLVDFWAEWCGPCKMIAPILDDIAADYAGKLTVAKINIDDNPVTPQRYGVRGIPTLILFKNGEVEATKVGALAKSQLAAFIDANL